MEERELLEQEEVTTVDAKAAKKAFSKIGLSYLIGIILIYVVSALLQLVVLAIDEDLIDNMDFTLIVLSVVPMYLVGFPLVYLFVRKLPVEKLEKTKFSFGQWILNAFICLGLAYTANICGSILTSIIGNVTGKAVENIILNVATSVSPWMILLYMVILAPIGEEFMFRKLIVDRTAKYSKGMAILLSGLMFGLFHGNLNQFIYAFVIGCFFAFLYVKTGNIKISISMHMLFNFIGGFAATYMLELLNLEDYMDVLSSGDGEAIIKLVASNLGPWILYVLFIMFVLTSIVVGLILFIVFAAQGKYKVKENANALPKGTRAATAFGNVGMILYIVFWTGVILFQLFGLTSLLSSMVENMLG